VSNLKPIIRRLTAAEDVEGHAIFIAEQFVGTFKEFPPSQKTADIQVSDISKFINGMAPNR
jgi:hypothetical protein